MARAIKNEDKVEYDGIEPKKEIKAEYKPIKVEAKPVVVQKPPVVHHYTIENWKKVKEVYKCNLCDAFRDTKDEMVLHVLTHYPDKQDDILDQLLQEK